MTNNRRDVFPPADLSAPPPRRDPQPRQGLPAGHPRSARPPNRSADALVPGQPRRTGEAHSCAGEARSSRGVALIVALGLLVVLALLGAAFATYSGIERAVARNALDAARARLAAHAGFEAGLAHLRSAARHGEDANANGRLDPGEDANDNGRLDDFLGDTRWASTEAARPAFPLADASGRPVQMRIEGAGRAISGAFDVSTYAPRGDVYSLRIEDANARLHVNDGLGRPADTARLRGVLNRLGSRPPIDIPDLGDRLIARRPPEGYRSLHELRGPLTEAEWDHATPFLTPHAWVDRAVANPVPVSAYEDRRADSPYPIRYPCPANADASDTALYRFGRGAGASGLPDLTPVGFHRDAQRPVGDRDTHAAVYALDELHPQWIEMTSRAPVNVNLAPRPVLAALIEGVQGFFVLGRSFSPYAADRLYAGPTTDPLNAFGNWFRLQLAFDTSRGATAGGEFGHLYLTEPFTREEADALADRLVAERVIRPFRSWAQFEDFLDGLVWHPMHNPQGILSDSRERMWEDPAAYGPQAALAAGARRHAAARARADALKANFNPNLHLNELNPDRSMARLVDKTDLVVGSTELCFQPRGIFRIESTGLILAPVVGDGGAEAPDADHRIVAEARVAATVRLWDAACLTSMKDFWGSDGRRAASAGGAVAGDRLAGFLPADARAEGRGAFYNTNNNRALEIGPEPDNGLDDAELESLEYDGYVALATTGGVLPHSAYREGRTKDKWRTWRTRRSDYNPAGDLLHAHFQFDADAHYARWSAFSSARDHLRRNFARRHDEGSWAWNFFNYADQPVLFQDGASDPVRLAWPTHGPYCAAHDGPAGYDVDPATRSRGAAHRCGRSYRGEPGRPLLRRAYPPQDLRLDGLYVERHSSVAFTAGPDGENFDPRRGAIAYWIKPAFAPEHAGSVKKFFSAARLHDAGEAPDAERALAIRHFNPAPFGHFFLPAPGAPEDIAPVYGPANGRWPTRAFAFGWGFSERGPTGTRWGLYNVADGAGADGERLGAEGGVVTPCLNHVGHRDEEDPRERPAQERAQNLLASNRWIHVIAAWDMAARSPDLAWRMWVNGRERPSPADPLYRLSKMDPAYRLPAEPFSGDRDEGRARTWLYDDFGGPNPIRIGEPSRLEHAPCPVSEVDQVFCPFGHRTCTMLNHYAMNFVPDSTVDEFYVWGDPALGPQEGLDRLWRVGRYYRGGDGWYLTPPIDVAAGRRAAAAPPAGTASMPECGVRPTTPASTPSADTARLRPRLLALAWTARAGSYDRDRDRLVVFDYQSEPPAPRRAWLRAAVSVDGGGTWRGRNPQGAADPRRLREGSLWEDDGWSSLTGEAGDEIAADDPCRVRIAMHFAMESDPLNSILLESLALDDLTLFYEPARLEVLEYVAQ